MHDSYILGKNICKTLFQKGYTAYFAGGWVRDWLLKHPSSEIDIATSAPPYVVQELFEKTVAVGISFGVVVVVLEGINFEVTTFRKDHSYIDGRHPEGVDFSTPEKDALRRDFTINGMFYDPLTETIYDHVGGQEDLKRGIIRAIGNPYDRFKEDRLRMVRGVRFASRFKFPLEEKTREAIRALASELFPSVSIERIWQELNKMASYPRFDQALLMLFDVGLLQVIFPQIGPISRTELERRVAAFPYFPLKTPPMAYLLELFPHLNKQEQLHLSLYLKTSLQERKLIEFFAENKNLNEREGLSDFDWAHFYAHPLSTLLVAIWGAKKIPPERLPFLAEHQERQQRLQAHIERIVNKSPLVTAAHLQKLGIRPGKAMGTLLKEAEKIAINENGQTADEVLAKLKLD